MPVFRPLTAPDALVGGGESSHPLWRHYGALQAGTTCWKYKADIPFTDIERTSNVVSVSFPSPHGQAVGDIITVVEPSDSSFNGTFTITETPSAFLLKYAQTGPDLFVGVAGYISFWKRSGYPYQGGAEYTTFDDTTYIRTVDDPEEGLATAVEYYIGGGEYLVTDDKATELRAAGFSSGVSYDSYLKVNGISSYFETPDAAHLNPVNLDARIFAQSVFPNWIPVFLSNHVFSKGSSASWVLSIHPDSQVRTAIYPAEPNGDIGPGSLDVPGFIANKPHWMRTTIKFYPGVAEFRYWRGPDGKDWYPFGDRILMPSIKSGLTNTVESLMVPGSAGGLSWLDRVLYAELRDDIDGNIVANPDFRNLAPGTTSFTDTCSFHNVWTRVGTAVEVVGV